MARRLQASLPGLGRIGAVCLAASGLFAGALIVAGEPGEAAASQPPARRTALSYELAALQLAPVGAKVAESETRGEASDLYVARVRLVQARTVARVQAAQAAARATAAREAAQRQAEARKLAKKRAARAAARKEREAREARVARESSDESGGSSGGGSSAVAIAMGKLSASYRHGGSGPWSFDCSGFTMWVYRQLGISLPHSSSGQRAVTRRISSSEKRPGDLVFVYNGGGGSVGHVAIYAGNGYWIEAANPRADVRKTRPWSSNVSYGRV